MTSEPFELPASVGVPILGAPADPKRSDTDEALARLAFFVCILAQHVSDNSADIEVGKFSFILGGATDILERYGPIDVEHEFGG